MEADCMAGQMASHSDTDCDGKICPHTDCLYQLDSIARVFADQDRPSRAGSNLAMAAASLEQHRAAFEPPPPKHKT
jgi:hypothetical protein